MSESNEAKPGIKKERLIFGLFLLVLIVAIELVLHQFHLSGWPVFLVMIFFFEMHMDKSRAHHIIIGGLVGIAAYLGTVQFVGLTGDALGATNATILFICMVVYCIVAFGEILPQVFNNYAFMYYLVAGTAATAGNPTPLIWAGQVVIGGAVVIGGILTIATIMAKITKEADANASNETVAQNAQPSQGEA